MLIVIFVITLLATADNIYAQTDGKGKNLLVLFRDNVYI